MNQIFIFLILISFTLAVKETIMTFHNGVSVKMSLPKNDKIKFTISVPESNKWVILGFGNETKAADFFLIESETNFTTITDMEFNNDNQGIIDVTNDYLMKTEIEEVTKIHTVTRNLDTQDLSDNIIKDGENSIFIAFGSDSIPEFLEDIEYEYFMLEVASINRNLQTTGSKSASQDMALLHGLFTYFAWNWFSLILIISGRYSKYFYSFRIYLHGIVGILALTFDIIGESFSDIQYFKSQNSIGDAHTGVAGIISTWAGAM